MTMFVIRNEHWMYVAAPGSAKSYTRKLDRAHRYPTREAAEAECCGNERAVSLHDLR